jgi:Tfp pilus assembly protein PilO
MNAFRLQGNARLASRLSALGLVVLCVLVVSMAIALPLASAGRENQQQLNALMQQLDTYRRVLAKHPLLEQEVQRLKQWRSVQRAYLDQETDALAAAYLQSLAKRQVARTLGHLSSMQVNPIRQEGSFVRISVNIKMQSNLSNLVKLFHGLSRVKPVIFLDQVAISSLRRGTSARRNNDRELKVSFDLIGYKRVDSR